MNWTRIFNLVPNQSIPPFPAAPISTVQYDQWMQAVRTHQSIEWYNFLLSIVSLLVLVSISLKIIKFLGLEPQLKFVTKLLSVLSTVAWVYLLFSWTSKSIKRGYSYSK